MSGCFFGWYCYTTIEIWLVIRVTDVSLRDIQIFSTMKTLQIVTALLGTMALSHADTVVTSFGTVSGPDDADQAGPMWGMSITPNDGAKPSGAYGELYLQSMVFQSSSSGSGANVTEQSVYLQVYDRFAVDGSGKIIELGELITSSTNVVKTGGAGKSETLTWRFDGSVVLKGNQNYMFVMSTDRSKAATVADYSHLVTGAFELKSDSSYQGGIGFLGNSNRKDWDLEFKAEFSSKAGMVKQPAAVLGLGEFTLILCDPSE